VFARGSKVGAKVCPFQKTSTHHLIRCCHISWVERVILSHAFLGIAMLEAILLGRDVQLWLNFAYIYFRALIMYPLFKFSYAIQKSFMETQGSNFDMACGIYIAIITKNLHIHQKLWFFPLWVSFDTWNIPNVKFAKTPSFKIEFIIILFIQKQLHQLSIQSQLSFGHHNVPNYNTWMVHKSPF